MTLAKIILTSFILFSVSNFVLECITPQSQNCYGAELHQVRIHGCNQQPCTIMKGHKLSFEIDLSLQMNIQPADRFYFDIYTPDFAVPYPAGSYGSFVKKVSCEDENPEFTCPITPYEKYTLKSFIIIDNKAVCRACKELEHGETNTTWTFFITSSKQINSLAQCGFEITLNVVA